MFSKILIANRGEIAVRLIRACRELGVISVAVYSEPDRQAMHVRLADEAYPIGPAAASESYLNIPRLLAAAQAAGAEAVHPGYGFLSENADFAAAVTAAGLTFIGPPAEAIRAMGDKAAARVRMQAAGVPVVPGYDGPDEIPTLQAAADRIGYPVLVKAAAGGGGKGMRVIASPDELPDAVASARREAQKAFSADRLLLEKYIPHARHIEIQVLADQHGRTVHLFERECSLQRRHQKVVEETPSPYLQSDPSGELRAAMGAAAVAAAEAVGYTNAGTVEFIVDPAAGRFYFLEMNTRLQVEHPITELTTGLDLAQWQIRIAAGEAMPFSQNELHQRGHAIECRLYAEDPANNFLPASGELLEFKTPSGPGLRVDSGFSRGDRISVHYDPLIAKLIAYAEDRPAAIRRMIAALRATVLLGVTSNGRFLLDVLEHPDFQAGQVYTTWLEEQFDDWQFPECELPPEVLVAAALTQLEAAGSASGAPAAQPGRDPYSPWRRPNGFRLGEENR